jgi:hypothetical protein
LIRADARIEAFADEAVANRAPTVITTAAAAAIPPTEPREGGKATCAAWATGASWLSSDHGTTPSIVESLRSASERLQNLTDEDAEDGGASDDGDSNDLAESAQDTLDRLRSRLGRTGTDDEDDSESVLTDNQVPSMFDMMEEQEDE